jgi:hypothetical protein
MVSETSDGCHEQAHAGIEDQPLARDAGMGQRLMRASKKSARGP